MYKKAADTRQNKSQHEKDEISRKRRQSCEKYYQQVRGKKRIDYLIELYGVEEGAKRYKQNLIRAFAGSSRMSGPAKKIYDALKNKLTTKEIQKIYCDSDGNKEFWLLDENNKMFAYDFTDRESKTILEFYGDFWHPKISSEEVHPITNKTLQEMYDYDIYKRSLAEQKGFCVIVIRSSDSDQQQNEKIDLFVQRVKNKHIEV